MRGQKLHFEIGQRIGKWEVMAETGHRQKSQLLWRCRCECGIVADITASALENGRSSSCVSCRNILDRCPFGHALAEWGRSGSGTCRGCIKDKSLRREYHISLEEYVAIWERQNGRCAICGRPLDKFPKGTPGWHEALRAETDHEHDKSRPTRLTVRGLLCGGRWAGCNRRLGKIDDIQWLEKVMAYLKNPPAQQVLIGDLPSREKK